MRNMIIMKRIIVLSIIVLLMTGCADDNPISYVENELGLRINNAKIEKYKDKEESFNGDGTRFIVLKNLNKDFVNKIKNKKDWNHKLSKVERLALYGGKIKKDYFTEPFVTDDNDKMLIPKIKNAYYYFKDTEWFENEKEKEKERRFDPIPRNFIIAVYDVDNNRLYYYEYDS